MKRVYAFCICSVVWMACSSPIKVSSDYDKAANFSRYKTYAFTEGAEKLPVTDINRTRLLQAVSNELAKEGFTKSDQPDVWVDLKMLTENKRSATATTSPMYGPGYGYTMAPTFSTTSIEAEHYLKGTLFVDMIDLSTRQLVWQGRAEGIIDPQASPEKRERKINVVMQKIFTKYPPVK